MVLTNTMNIFEPFKTMRRKQNSASALGTQRQIEDNHALFGASIWKRALYIALYFTATVD